MICTRCMRWQRYSNTHINLTMRLFATLLVFIVQFVVINEEIFYNPNFESSCIFPRKSAIDRYIPEFGLIGALIVFLCFTIAKINYERNKINGKYQKRLSALRSKALNEMNSASQLEPYMEESRSRNSCIEMPLRRMSLKLDEMIQKTQERIQEYLKLEQEFGGFREMFKQQLESIRCYPEKIIIATLVDAKVRAELDGLKEFIDKEMKEIIEQVGQVSDRMTC